MARYHDFDAKTHGPRSLAKFLRLPLSSVFPISYDISAHCVGDRVALVGTIEARPKERLTRAQIIALAVPKVRVRSLTMRHAIHVHLKMKACTSLIPPKKRPYEMYSSVEGVGRMKQPSPQDSKTKQHCGGKPWC
jgi:hypothetical protein